MSFFDKINNAWEKGKDGTPEVNLREGISAVFKIAERATEENVVGNEKSVSSTKSQEIYK